MPKIDIPIKRLLQIKIEDWIEFLIPNCKKEWVTEMDPSKVPAKKESRLDKLILINSPKERFILNIEPQGYLDYTMSARMLRYRSDIWEYTIANGLGTPSIKQAVIYFYKGHDNKQYDLKDSWGNTKTLEFNYKAIKVWELKKTLIIEQKLEGLYALLPLMDIDDKETDEDVMELTMKTINTVKSPSLQADLLAVMSILVGEKFTTDLVKKYIRRSMLMNSPIYNEWIEEERKEAADKATKVAKEVARIEAAKVALKATLAMKATEEVSKVALKAKEEAEKATLKAKEEAEKATLKAKEEAEKAKEEALLKAKEEALLKAEEEALKATLETSKKKLIELLSVRFDMLQLSIIKNIKELKDDSMLDELFRKAIIIPSIEDFEKLLCKAIKMQE